MTAAVSIGLSIAACSDINITDITKLPEDSEESGSSGQPEEPEEQPGEEPEKNRRRKHSISRLPRTIPTGLENI